jgi:alpha 1,2-mannosyltransferase
MASGDVEYGLIDKREWSVPSWIDTNRVQRAMDQMVKDDVIYGGSVSYRYTIHIFG